MLLCFEVVPFFFKEWRGLRNFNVNCQRCVIENSLSCLALFEISERAPVSINLHLHEVNRSFWLVDPPSRLVQEGRPDEECS